MMREFLRNCKSLFGGRPALPKCKTCGDDLLLELESAQGLCLDCLPPAYTRENRKPHPDEEIGLSPRAFGRHGSTR